jgi:LysM repeat protein
MEETSAPSRSGEMRNFIILVVVLLGTILVVAFLRPFIFGRVVPAILGEGLQEAPLVDDKPVDEDIGTEMGEGGEKDGDTTTADSESSENDASGTEAVEGENGESNSDNVDPESFPESIATVEHIVQPGDTLYALSRRYKVSVSEIVAANKLNNPDRLAIGSKLLIPQPEGND